MRARPSRPADRFEPLVRLQRPLRLATCLAVLLVSPAARGTADDRLRRARDALEAGRPRAALEALDGDLSPLNDYAAFLRARARTALGETPEALAELAPIRRRPTACQATADAFGVRVGTLRSELLAKTDLAASAAALLALPPDGARFELARARLSKAGDEKRAEAVERRMLLEVPEHPAAVALAERLGAAGVAKRIGDLDDRVKRARELLDRHANAAAHAESRALRRALKKGDLHACELAYIEGKAARKLRRYKTATLALARARRICAPTLAEYAVRVGLLEVHVHGIRGRTDAAKRSAQWLEKHYGDGHTYIDDAWFVVAERLAKAGRRADAERIYTRIADRLPRADHAGLAAWRLAFDDITRGRRARAVGRLKKLLDRRVPRALEHDRARYWLDKLAPRDPAAKAWTDALVARPSFYTWMLLDRARREDHERAKELEARLMARVRAAPKTSAPSGLDNHPATRRALALFALGELELAEDELGRHECGVLARGDAVALATAFVRVGAHARAQWVLRRRPPLLAELSPERAEVWRMAYSRPFEDEIRAAAASEGLEPLFLFALVREESTFDPEIVSWAGATGLAQLMPPTAIGAYASVFGGRLDLARLTDPVLNLRLGAHVLKDGVRRFRTEALALAAYNGGPGLAARSLPKKPTPFDRWVETIPVKETRRYVKKVLGTWGIYRFLYDPERRFVELPDVVSRRRLR